MENEIKVGEYIRTKDGKIIKFNKFGTLRVGCTNPKYYKTIISNRRHYKYDDIIKHSPNLIDILEDKDFCKIEFYSPRYKERVIRIFEVSKIDEYITFENFHCDLFMVNGEWSCHDKKLNPVIKEIYTKEMMESISYKVIQEEK